MPKQVLLLKHPGDKIRDTSRYGPLREIAGTKQPALRTLAKKVLDLDIQQGEHSSVRPSDTFLVCTAECCLNLGHRRSSYDGHLSACPEAMGSQFEEWDDQQCPEAKEGFANRSCAS